MFKTKEIRQFREGVYQIFGRSRDAAFEVIDAIASSPHARSAVEVSESELMLRTFASVYKALERVKINTAALIQLLTQQAMDVGELEVDGYVILALDHTPFPRKSAPTVSDRGYVHGADGTQVGHQYSLLGRIMHAPGAWVGVFDCERIATCKTPVQVGAEQIQRLRQTIKRKCIITADSEYATREIIEKASETTAILVRLRSNRTLFHRPNPRRRGQRGAPAKHGRKVYLSNARTWGKASAKQHVDTDDGGGIAIEVFCGLHLKSNPTVEGSLIVVWSFHADGSRKFKQPICLFWTGPQDMDWATFWRVYLKRFCLESVHQFSKNSLSWTRARLGYTEREEHWTWLVMLAYWQLLMAIPIARDNHRPWEKPMPAGRLPTPARVQRDYFRIFALVGTPVCAPKRRGISFGRPFGYRPAPRMRYATIYKAANTS